MSVRENDEEYNISENDDNRNVQNLYQSNQPEPIMRPHNMSGFDVYDKEYIENEKPIYKCTYEYIRLFGDLYPTIIGLMGGTEVFPPETIKISCYEIPPNYDTLSSLPELLWRFNDYSYCRYLEYNWSRQLDKALDCKISTKVRYLQSM